MEYRCNQCGIAECKVEINTNDFTREVVLNNIRCPFSPLGKNENGTRKDSWKTEVYLEDYINDEENTCRFCKHWNLLGGENGGWGNCNLHPCLTTSDGDDTWDEYAHRCRDFDEDENKKPSWLKQQ